MVYFRHINVIFSPSKFSRITNTRYFLSKSCVRAAHIQRLPVLLHCYGVHFLCAFCHHLSLPLVSPLCTQWPSGFTPVWTNLSQKALDSAMLLNIRLKLLIFVPKPEKIPTPASSFPYPQSHPTFPRTQRTDSFFLSPVALPSPLYRLHLWLPCFWYDMCCLFWL